jgi:hypothetical protein
LYLPAQLTSFVFTQDKRLPYAETALKARPHGPHRKRGASSIVKLKRREPARPSGLDVG